MLTFWLQVTETTLNICNFLKVVQLLFPYGLIFSLIDPLELSLSSPYKVSKFIKPLFESNLPFPGVK